MAKVSYDDLSAAFAFVTCGAPLEHQAFVSRETGTIYWVSEALGDEEDLPDDLESSDRYIAVPHANDLDLGNRLVLRFARERLPHRLAVIAGFFQRRGAYARLKELLASERCLDAWYAYEADATERALRDWCRAHEIELDDE